MRSRKPARPRYKNSLSDRQVQALAEDWLAQAVSLEQKARKCTGSVLWKIVLLAAARMVSLFAACRDLSGAPSDEAVRQALRKRLPKRVTCFRFFGQCECLFWFSAIHVGSCG